MRSGRGLLAAAALALLAAVAGAKDEFLPAPPRPDPAFYAARVAPYVEAHCVSCHRRGAGALRLTEVQAGVDDAQRRRQDFERLRFFVNAEVPWESRLLLKPLDPAAGGDPHVGGAFLQPDTEAYDTLLDFVSGATLANLPPEVWFETSEVQARPGETVSVDGRGSFDRDPEDMDRLVYAWELFARPAESQARVTDRRASRLEFVPDTGGTFVFRLRVGDGKVWSAPRALTIEVFDHVPIQRTSPGGISGLAAIEPGSLRRLRRLYLDVLGRPPTPAEAVAERRQGTSSLVKNVLLRAESGRAWVESAAIRLGLYDDFRPVGEEATSLALRIPAENLAPPAVESALARDPAFARRHASGRAFVQAVAQRLLDRAATDDEIAGGIELGAGRGATMPGVGPVATLRDWLLAVLASPAFERAAVHRRLRRFLDSGDARTRLERALGAVRAGPQAWRAFMETLLQDENYLERRHLRRKEDVTLLRSLFVDLLERKPTDRELAALVRAVETMPGESAAFAAVVRVLIDSGEAPIPLLVEIVDAPGWLTDRFLRYLGRRPQPAELKAYGEVLVDPHGGPELVIQALLTGAEYACR